MIKPNYTQFVEKLSEIGWNQQYGHFVEYFKSLPPYDHNHTIANQVLILLEDNGIIWDKDFHKFMETLYQMWEIKSREGGNVG